MSIADQITALQANLRNAKTAIQDRGGNTSDTGMAGLANEISRISKIPFKVKITYLTDNVDTGNRSVRTLNCSVSGSSKVPYSFYACRDNSTMQWRVIRIGGIEYMSDSELTNKYGVTVTPEDENGFHAFAHEINISSQVGLTSQGYADLGDLNSFRDVWVTEGGIRRSVPRENITEVSIERFDNTCPEYFVIPAGFCCEMPSLRTVRGAGNIIDIGSGVFSGCPSLELTLGNYCRIGSYSLAGAKIRLSPIVLNGTDVGAFAKPRYSGDIFTTLGNTLSGFWGMTQINFKPINAQYVQLKGVGFGEQAIESTTINTIFSLEMCSGAPTGIMQKKSAHIDTNAPIYTQGTYGLKFRDPGYGIRVYLGRDVQSSDFQTGWQGLLCNSNVTEIFFAHTPQAGYVDNKTFAATDPTAEIYSTGLTLHVPSNYVDTWQEILPNSDVTPYRKVTVVGDYNLE